MTFTDRKGTLSRHSVVRQPKKTNPRNAPAVSKIAIVEQPSSSSDASSKPSKKKKNLTKDPEDPNQVPENLPPFMPMEPISGVPLGLEFLVEIDKLKIKQQTKTDHTDLMEVYKDDRRYDILTSDDRRIYYAVELLTERFIACGEVERPFRLLILDYTGRGVLDIRKDADCKLYCTSCCFFCCGCLGTIGGKADVYLPDKTFMGTVAHSYGFYRPIYNVRDSKGNIILIIRGLVRCGDCCIHQRCQNVDNIFRIVSPKGDEIGAIRRSPVDTIVPMEGSAIAAEQDHKVLQDCLIRFTRDLDVSTKALLLGAAFLISWMYYGEESSKDEEDYEYSKQRRKSKRRSEAAARASRAKIGN